MKVNKMKPIERLRASRLSTLQDDYAAGKIEGRSWAAKVATYDELASVSRFYSTAEQCRNTDQVSHQAIERDQLALAAIKKSCVADDLDHVTAVFAGFLEGANEFFEKVKDQV
jgi:hypothetical protein